MITNQGEMGTGTPGIPGADEPLLPDVGVLTLPESRWSPVWSTQERIMRELSRFFRVAWLNPPPHWRKLFSSPSAYALGTRTEVAHLEVVSTDFLFPDLYRPEALARVLREVPVRRARARLERLGVERTVLYLWHYQWGWVLDRVVADATCYHIKDEYSYSPVDVPTPPEERALLERADQVFTVSASLLEKKGGFCRHAALVPNGVDYDLHAEPGPEPEDLHEIPRPIVGYTGWIKKQLDWELVAHLSERHPEWSFVFVGSRSPHPEIEDALDRLAARPNIHFLGGRTSGELARYPAWMDVCIMPYVVNDYTRYIYPLKLHEYLAGGNPVVSSPIRAVEEFQEVVAIARSLEEWSRRIREALASGPSEAAAACRRGVAMGYDWSRLGARVACTIGDRLGIGDRVRRAMREVDGSPLSGSRERS